MGSVTSLERLKMLIRMTCKIMVCLLHLQRQHRCMEVQLQCTGERHQCTTLYLTKCGDQDSTQEESNNTGWGADTSQTFGSPNSNEDSGWGNSEGNTTSTWAPASEKQEPVDESLDTASPLTAPATIKHEQTSNTMETHVGDGEETAVWFMDRVCVQLKSDDRPAVIKEINPNKTALVELEDHTTQTVGFNEVSRIQPKEKDMVLVIGGADVGVEGELVCIDGSDAILKDSNEDFKIVDFVHLAKIAGDT